MACAPDPGANGVWDSRLVWTFDQYPYERLLRLVTDSNDIWVGLDDRAESGIWTGSDGSENVLTDDPIWEDPASSGPCAFVEHGSGG